MNLLLIDLSSLAHPLYHVSGREPDPNWTATQTVARVRALANGQSQVGIAAEGGRSFRKDISADYKANRPEHDAALQHQIALAIETLKADGFPVWSAKGYEADDVLATAAALALVHHDCDVTIATSDKDLMQLVGPRVTIKSLTNGNVLDADAVELKFGVKPNQVLDFLALVGDSSDNIKGANGIGPKKAAELLRKYGTIEDLYAALTTHGTQFTPGIATALREFEPRLKTTRELLTLRTDADIPFVDVFKERVAADVAIFGGEPENDDAGRAQDIEDAMQPLHEAASQPVTTAPTSVTQPDGSATTGELGPSSPNGAGSGASSATVATSTAPARVVPSAADSGQSLVPFERALEPRDLNQALMLSKAVYLSRHFSAYGSAEGIFATILAGRELGMPAMVSLRGFHVIEGKTAMHADLIRARVLTYEKCEYFRCVERTTQQATFVTKRKDDPEVSLTYSIAEGRLAFGRDEKAWNASGWGKNPADMLVARASAKLARLVYPERVHGFYAPEELEN